MATNEAACAMGLALPCTPWLVEIYIVGRFTEDGVVTLETTVSIFQDSIQTLSLSGPGEDTKHVHNDNHLAYTDIASFVKGSIDVSDDKESALIDLTLSLSSQLCTSRHFPIVGGMNSPP